MNNRKAYNCPTCNEIDHRDKENQSRRNEHNHPVVIHGFLIRKVKRPRKKIRGAAVDRQRLEPLHIGAKRPVQGVAGEHYAQADPSGGENCE